VRVGVTLGIIVILIVGGIYVARLLGARAGLSGSTQIEVVDRCFIAPKRALYSVRLGDRVVVVGVTETTITPVTEFSPTEGEELYPAAIDGPTRDLPFPKVFRNMAGRLSRTGA